jgi:Na+/H+ antiporter NhaD/arsenite permease-like protein
MVLAGMYFGFYMEEEAILSVKFEALGLLLGMMILISTLEPIGFCQYAEIKAR